MYSDKNYLLKNKYYLHDKAVVSVAEPCFESWVLSATESLWAGKVPFKTLAVCSPLGAHAAIGMTVQRCCWQLDVT